MNDVKVHLKAMEEVAMAAKPDELSFAETAGLFAASEALAGLMRDFLRAEEKSDSYCFEKISNFRWHVAAALKFDVDNGHDASKHRSWALGALDSLESQLSLVLGNDRSD